MTENDMKKLSRADLLRIVANRQEAIEELQAENALLKEKLEEREALCEQADSLAQAALYINQVVEAAQAAADLYVYNLKRAAQSPKESNASEEHA